MSRTIRCTQIKPDRYIYFSHERLEDGSWGEVRYSDKEIKKRLARYHSDTAKYRRYLGSAPQSYCNYYQRSMRMKAKTELHKFKVNEDYEVMITANHRRSASYGWW